MKSPPRVALASLPTPLVSMPALTDETGVRLLCKRDDLTGAALSGNKIRKLEFLLADALDRSCDRVITCGGQQSNHARATAIAAARLGLKCHLLLRTERPDNPPPPEGNILLDRLAGATVRWISSDDYARRDELMRTEAIRLDRDDGGHSYVIPEGGSNALGAWGYIVCAQELGEQLGPTEATVVYPVGSGGTAAGLIAGCRALELPYRLVGICVCDDRGTFQRRISRILGEMSVLYSIPGEIASDAIEIWEDYVGLGYGLSRPEELRCIVRVARAEGLITDPVYTGKALYGLLHELERGTRLPEPVVFLHTGGIFGLFSRSDELGPMLDDSV